MLYDIVYINYNNINYMSYMQISAYTTQNIACVDSSKCRHMFCGFCCIAKDLYM